MTLPDNLSIKHDQLPAFQRAQLEFTATIRDPINHKTPDGIEEQRMAVYRELVSNNIEDLLASFFPVLKEITPPSKWHAMVRAFIANHKCRTPIFMKLAEEFLQFLQSEHSPQTGDPEYLLELAHYEWMEIAASVADEEPKLIDINREGNLLDEAPAISPLTWPLHYQYPVHKVSPDFHPAGSGQTFLVVYRDFADDVQFMELKPVSARLLDLLKINEQRETKAHGMQLLLQIADEMEHPNPDAVVTGGLQTMRQWFKRDIILGTHKLLE
jgi:hypothetical protein